MKIPFKNQYQKLKQDFANPLKALLYLNRLLSDPVILKTKSGQPFPTTKDDFPIWSEYFEPKTCHIEIQNELFKVKALKTQAEYFIKGGNYKITHEPKRFFPEVLKNELFRSLQESEKKVFSQHGEDGVIEKIFQMIPAPYHFVVEFGAHDGVKMSNSRNLIHHHNWNGFLIEADPQLYQQLESVYAQHPRVKILKSFVTVENINSLFQSAQVPKDFELLSIDVDSIDYFLWEALTDFQPRLVIVECNPIISPDVSYVAPAEKARSLGGTQWEGASFKAFVDLGKKKGYELIYTELIGSNLFFVHRDWLKNLPYSPLDDKLKYQPPQFGQLVDGPAPNGRGYL